MLWEFIFHPRFTINPYACTFVSCKLMHSFVFQTICRRGRVGALEVFLWGWQCCRRRRRTKTSGGAIKRVRCAFATCFRCGPPTENLKNKPHPAWFLTATSVARRARKANGNYSCCQRSAASSWGHQVYFLRLLTNAAAYTCIVWLITRRKTSRCYLKTSKFLGWENAPTKDKNR